MAGKKKASTSEKNAEAEKVVCRNRKAKFNYDIIDTVECGLVLKGTEVKSLRAGKGSIEEAFARVEKGEVWIYQLEIPEYAMGNIMNHPVKRTRKLLMHKREINKFAAGAAERGFTLIPTQLYFKGGIAKLELALAKGKKLHDKRETIKTKEANRAMKRAIGRRRDF